MSVVAGSLRGQTVVVIGGSAGIGLKTARRARVEGADVTLTGRNPDRLRQAALEVDAFSTATFDANDLASLERFFEDLATPIDQVMITAGAPALRPSPRHGPRRAGPRLWRTLSAHRAGRPVRRRQGQTGGHAVVHGWHRRPLRRRRPGACVDRDRRAAGAHRQPGARAGTDPRQPHRRRVRRHAAVGIPPRDGLEARREQLRATLPIRRVVTSADVAAVAVHIMTNTALTGATYDIDGGQQLIVPAAT
jgi:NAD(P)-dependent dehydrogenase (short-subunit alcohol dehydrogenase family)